VSVDSLKEVEMSPGTRKDPRTTALGEGLTTGHIWLPTPGNRDMQLSTASGDFMVWTERFVYRNQTTGVVLDWPLRVTFVTNANGEVKVDRIEDDVCTLRH
jgi:hypothetical protein